MTTAATITANLVLNSKDYQSGIKKAEKGTRSFSDKLKQMQTHLENSAGKTTFLSGKIWQLRQTLENAGRSPNMLARGMENIYNASEKVKGAINNLKTQFINLDQRIRLSGTTMSQVGDKFLAAGKKMTLFITVPIIGFFTVLIKKAMDADTALGKLAKESIGRLNDSLAKLGEKFLPLFIKFVDWVTKLVDEFLALPPETQEFITKLILLAAMAGPMSTFAGTLMKVFSFFSGAGVGGQAIAWIGSALIPALKVIGTTITTSLWPAIVSLGSAIWTALLPLLPILALVAAVVLLIYLLWKNWDQLGVIITQLWTIIKWAFSQGWNDIKAKTKEGLDWFNAEWKKSNKTWEANQKQWSEIQTKLFKLAMNAMHMAIMEFVMKATTKFMELRNWAISTWNSIASSFYSAFQGISNFFESVKNSIIAGIQAIISAANELIATLQSIVLPDELTPGSPTPFEMGLRGIAKAMNTLSRESVPQFNQSFAAPSGVTSVGTGKTINVVDNRRFAAGIGADVMRTMLDDRFDGLSKALEAA